MARPPFHITMNVIKRTIIERAKEMAQNDEESFTFSITIVDDSGGEIARVQGTINRVQNALVPDVFGANVTLEGHYFNVTAGEGVVDYDLILPQIDDSAFIGPSSIHIRGFELIQCDDPNAFHDQVHQQILNEW